MRELPPIDYKSLFRHLQGLFLILTPEFIIVEATDAYLAATMTKRNEIIGKGLFEVFPDNPREADATGVSNLSKSLARVLKERRTDAMAVQKYDVAKPEAEGGEFEERYWSPVNAPLLNMQGEVEFIIHRAEDVTEFVRMQRQQEEDNKLSSGIKDRMRQMEVDVFHRAQQLQDTNERLRDAEQALDQKNRELQDANEEMATLNEELISSNEALKATNDQLEATSAKLKEALDHQMALVEAKSRIVSIASHELRTPVSVISISAGFIKKYKERMTAPEIDVKLDNIHRQVANISFLINDILTLGKGESNTLKAEKKEVNLPDFFLRLKNDVESSMHNTHTITLELNVVDYLKTDDNLLRNIFVNLISNAIKYSPNQKEVVVKAFMKAGYLTVHVIDHGIGIPEHQVKELFSPWFRASNSSGFAGHGLGLSIVKKALELLHGDISVKSSAGQTEFIVNLPVS